MGCMDDRTATGMRTDLRRVEPYRLRSLADRFVNVLAEHRPPGTAVQAAPDWVERGIGARVREVGVARRPCGGVRMPAR